MVAREMEGAKMVVVEGRVLGEVMLGVERRAIREVTM